MRGQMMRFALTTTEIMRYAARHLASVEVVALTGDLGRHATTYGGVFERAGGIAAALAALGVERGDRVATLAWNDHRHLELYYGVSGAGYVLHTVNPRLFHEQLVYILNHAEDRVLCLDPMFLPLVEAIADRLPRVEHYVVLTSAAEMPETALAPVRCYESLLESAPSSFHWPELDENEAAALCYTSGTTGDPKGVLYSHRATVLHALSCCTPSVMSIGPDDTVLPVVPMFHVNAWGIPYSAVIAGAKLVLPGPKMGDAATLQNLIDGERVTIALGVPTVWTLLLEYLRDSGRRVDTLERLVIGGAACPLALMQAFDEYGVYVHHAWGMTETSPLGTFNRPPRDAQALSQGERDALRVKQGRPPFGIDLKVVDDAGRELPRDGVSSGELKVRGAWVCDSYFGAESEAQDAEGWFATGDVATIDATSALEITDRSKDVIKSGGEWISSIALECIAAAHPGVAEAAVIAVAHPKWGERPLLVVVPRAGHELEPAELLASFEGKVADWWIPNAVELVDAIPHTATGKVSKLELRQKFAGYALPQDQH